MLDDHINQLIAHIITHVLYFTFPKDVLCSKTEGDSKVEHLKRQSKHLCEQEDLEEGRKQEIQESVRGTEEQWRTALQIVEEVLSKAKIQTLIDDFQAQTEGVQSWIRDQEQKLQSPGGHMHVEEKPQTVQVSLRCFWISVETL